MGPLDSLRQFLKTTNAQAFQGLTFEHKKLEKEIEKLKTWLGTNVTAKPPSNLIREALARFYEMPNTESLRDIRLICYGCVDVGDRGYRLMEDAERFPKLLDCVDKYKGEARPFRRCYKGLLNGYFTYDPNAEGVTEAGQLNWNTLRSYLHDRTANLPSKGMLPGWVQAITKHDNLTTSDPCSRYGLSLLEDSGEEFSEAQRELEISNASWVTIRLILAQIDAAINLDDAQFRRHIPRLLDLLEKHQVILNTGLARVLIRYQHSANPSVHPELRDFSVGHWGNPWLASNSARWAHVLAAARDMVADWLKLELIHHFFNLLAEDGTSDTRRLKFWQRYHKHIDDMYFALGRRAASNKSRDFLELRKKMQGRLLNLSAAGPPENNAFIMCIGNYVIVEFGIKGNACFVFRRSALPFALSGNVAGDGSALKHPSHVERLVHNDRNYENWEGSFETILHRNLTVRPARDDGLPAGVGAPSGRTISSEATSAPRGTSAFEIPTLIPNRQVDSNYTRRELERFCAVRRFTVRDFTNMGGNLWVVTTDPDELVTRQLEAWGFTYKQDKGWWRKHG